MVQEVNCFLFQIYRFCFAKLNTTWETDKLSREKQYYTHKECLGFAIYNIKTPGNVIFMYSYISVCSEFLLQARHYLACWEYNSKFRSTPTLRKSRQMGNQIISLLQGSNWEQCNKAESERRRSDQGRKTQNSFLQHKLIAGK